MSYQLHQDDVLFHQRFLKANGFYKGTLDGDWGPKTDAADKAFEKRSDDIAAQEGTFDSRSEKSIRSLTPAAQIAARKFMNQCKAAGVDVRILSGTRTYAEQNGIYAQGRTRAKDKPIVSNARGGQSNHNFGIAWDIGIFRKGQYIGNDDKPYRDLARKVMPVENLQWGGDWKTFKDYPHYQCKACSDDLKVVRTNFEAGTAYV